MQVVEDALLTDTGVLVEGPVVADPLERRRDSRIGLVETGEEQALEARVGHRPVASQAAGDALGHRLAGAAFAGRVACERLATVRRGVDEPTVVGSRLRPVGGVGRLVVLRAAQEHEGPLHDGLVGADARVVERVEHHLGVREVGPTVTAVSGAAEPVAGGSDALALIPLILDESIDAAGERSGLRGSGVGADRGEAHDDGTGDIVAQSAFSEAVESASVEFSEHEAAGSVERRRLRRVESIPGLRERLQGERRHRHARGGLARRLIRRLDLFALHPRAAGGLLIRKPRQSSIERGGRRRPTIGVERRLGSIGRDAMRGGVRQQQRARNLRRREVGDAVGGDAFVERAIRGRHDQLTDLLGHADRPPGRRIRDGGGDQSGHGEGGRKRPKRGGVHGP